MTTLERFLVKKPTELNVEKKSSESLKLEPSTDLVVTIKNLKSIFPAEPEESLMLLALQHQNPKDLENTVQKLLEEGNSFNAFTKSWSTIKSRDKNKPNIASKRFKKGNERKNEEKTQNFNEKPEKKSFKPQNPWNDSHEEEKRNEIRKNDREPKKKYKIKSQKLEKVEEIKEILQEKKEKVEEKQEKTGQLTDLHYQLEEALQTKSRGSLPKLWSEVSVSPPQEINENSHLPPQTIPANPAPILSVHLVHPTDEVNPIMTQTHLKSSKPALEGHSNQEQSLKNPATELKTHQKTETRDFGVQVEMFPGIPLIVYPYMFHRS